MIYENERANESEHALNLIKQSKQAATKVKAIPPGLMLFLSVFLGLSIASYSTPHAWRESADKAILCIAIIAIGLMFWHYKESKKPKPFFPNNKTKFLTVVFVLSYFSAFCFAIYLKINFNLIYAPLAIGIAVIPMTYYYFRKLEALPQTAFRL